MSGQELLSVPTCVSYTVFNCWLDFSIWKWKGITHMYDCVLVRTHKKCLPLMVARNEAPCAYRWAWHYMGTRVNRSFLPHDVGKIKKRSGNTTIQCFVPKEFNQSCNHVLIFVYVVKIEVVRLCVQQMLLVTVWQWGTIALLINEDCCQDTSASNVHIAALQEIVKPKVIELNVLLYNSCCSSYICSTVKLFLMIFMLQKCIRGKSRYTSWSKN